MLLKLNLLHGSHINALNIVLKRSDSLLKIIHTDLRHHHKSQAKGRLKPNVASQMRSTPELTKIQMYIDAEGS